MEEEAKPGRENGCRCGEHKQILGESRGISREGKEETGLEKKNNLGISYSEISLLYLLNLQQTVCPIGLKHFMDFFNQSGFLFVLAKQEPQVEAALKDNCTGNIFLSNDINILSFIKVLNNYQRNEGGFNCCVRD